MAKNNEILPALAVRSSVGVELWSSAGFKEPYVQDKNFTRDESKFCRAIKFSPDGRYFVWANGANVQVSTTIDWKTLRTLPRPKAFSIKFSPKSTYLMTWEIFNVNQQNPDGLPNLFIYNVETGEEMFSIIQKRQTDWEPFWSFDETLLGLMVGGEVLFYDTSKPDGFKSSITKLGGGRNGKFSISRGNKKFVAFYVPGTKSGPSMCKLYQYPNLTSQPIACKSFFQADRVEMLWNKKGTDLLLLTTQDIDQTGASYYGKQALHFMSTTGDSFSVQLSKEGPIHAVEWSPKSNEFCVVFGYMPAKATIFNLKCDSVHNFEEAPRNSIYYNSFGNILLLAGFGNLRGHIEVWDVSTKKLITTIQAPDSTLLEWNPSGTTFVTATTAPRLRMSNGFKMWHYSGALLHETLWPTAQELYEVKWQQYTEDFFKEPYITSEKIEGIKSNVPQPSAQVYRPPNVRLGIEPDPKDNRTNIPGLYTTTTSTKSADKTKKKTRRDDKNWREKNENSDEKKSHTARPSNDDNDKTHPGQNNNNSNNRRPNRNNNNRRNMGSRDSASGRDNQKEQEPNERYRREDGRPVSERSDGRPRSERSDGRPVSERSDDHYGGEGEGSGRTKKRNFNKPQIIADPEKQKRMTVIQRKLKDIVKLKAKKERGEQLEIGQVTKLSSEAALQAELKQLSLN